VFEVSICEFGYVRKGSSWFCSFYVISMIGKTLLIKGVLQFLGGSGGATNLGSDPEILDLSRRE
jgi:hypothetical protein